MHDIYIAPFEFKLADSGAEAALGTFSGYAAVFGNIDGHGDIILPGAFRESLAERKAQGRGAVPLHVMHGVFGGDGLPIGVLHSVDEDERGLKVTGKVSGMNTDAGRLIYEKMNDGALAGLSIGYRVKRNGATYGTKPGEPKRTLKNLHLAEISLVDDPSNSAARLNELKAMAKSVHRSADDDGPHFERASSAFKRAMDMIAAGDEDTEGLIKVLQKGYAALSGTSADDSSRESKSSMPPVRVLERALREEGLSHTKSREVASRVRDKCLPREEGRKVAKNGEDDALGGLRGVLSGFTLP